MGFNSSTVALSDICILMRYIYLITNLINGKFYVGQTKNFSLRKAGHLYAARCGNERPLYRAIRKYGEDSFEFKVLEECEDEIVNEREQHWVEQYDSFNPLKGYNLTSGGNYPLQISDETRTKLSAALIAKWTNQTYREMMSKKASETFQNYWQTHGGHPQTLLRGFDWTGRRHSEETKRKIGETNSTHQQGCKNSRYGTVWIYNIVLRCSKSIHQNELETYLQEGWLKGRKMKW